MKKLILSIAITLGTLTGAGTATAQSNGMVEACGHIGDISENIMMMRQLGASEYRIRMAMQGEPMAPVVENIVNAIIKEVFQQPQVYTQAQRERLSREYGDEKNRQCLMASREVS